MSKRRHNSFLAHPSPHNPRPTGRPGSRMIALSTVAGLILLAQTQAEQPHDASLARKHDTIEFTNKDVLHGHLIGGSSAHDILWRTPHAAGPITFTSTNIANIRIVHNTAGAPAESGDRILLTNGDALIGRITELNENDLVLETSYAGMIEINRSMIRAILAESLDGEIIYEGPSQLKGWTLGHANVDHPWVYRNHTLIAREPSTIGRDLALPDVALVEFEIYSPKPPRFRLDLYTDNVSAPRGNTYYFLITPTSIVLGRTNTGRGSHTLRASAGYRFREKITQRFQLFVNRAKAELSMYVNNAFVETWKDPEAFAGAGQGILFQAQGAGGLEIRNIMVMRWNGILPEPLVVSAITDKDEIRFKNADLASGDIEGIDARQLTLKTQFASITTPLSRIKRVDFASRTGKRARFMHDDVRAYFRRDGYITLQLRAIKDGRLHGYSENTGEVSIALGALRAIRFNIYNDLTHPEFDQLLF